MKVFRIPVEKATQKIPNTFAKRIERLWSESSLAKVHNKFSIISHPLIQLAGLVGRVCTRGSELLHQSTTSNIAVAIEHVRDFLERVSNTFSSQLGNVGATIAAMGENSQKLDIEINGVQWFGPLDYFKGQLLRIAEAKPIRGMGVDLQLGIGDLDPDIVAIALPKAAEERLVFIHHPKPLGPSNATLEGARSGAGDTKLITDGIRQASGHQSTAVIHLKLSRRVVSQAEKLGGS